MPASKPSFELDEQVLDDLLLLAKHAGRIEEVVNLAGEVPPGAGFDDTARQVAEKTGMPAPEVEQLLSTVNNILRIQMRTRIDMAQFLEAATRAFEEKKDEPSAGEDLSTWKGAVDAIRDQLGKVGPDHPFSVARKAERLARTHENVVYEVKVITDLRPVFSKAGDKILESVVTHTLLIEYFDGSRSTRIELGLDASDLAELRKVCERAELKAVTLKEALKGIPWAAHLQLADQAN
jgi:hypothetical protein